MKLVANGTVQSIYAASYDAFAVQPGPRGQVLVADGRRIVELNEGGKSQVLTDLPDNAWSIAQDTRHRLWMGTETNGILVANPNGRTPTIPSSAAALLGHASIDGNGIVRKNAQ